MRLGISVVAFDHPEPNGGRGPALAASGPPRWPTVQRLTELLACVCDFPARQLPIAGLIVPMTREWT